MKIDTGRTGASVWHEVSKNARQKSRKDVEEREEESVATREEGYRRILR